MDNFIVINDIAKYVENLMNRGVSIVMVKKVGFITVSEIQLGEELTTYVGGDSGIVETRALAKAGQVIATKCDENGVAIKYENGHVNQWLVSITTLREKYEVVKGNLYSSKGTAQKMIKISESISFKAPWGTIQNIKAGGYLNITSLNDIYGIQYEDFLETYKEI